MSLTLSAEEFKNKYGQAGLDKFNVQQEEPGFLERVKQDYQKRESELAQRMPSQSTASNILQFGGAVAGGIGDVIGEGLTSLGNATDTHPLQSIGESIGSNKLVQQAVADYSSWKKQHPEAAANLEATGSIVQFLPLGKIAGTVGKATEGVVNAGSKVLKSVESAKPLAKKALEKGSELAYSTAIPLSDVEAGALQAYKAGYGKKPLLPTETAAQAGFAGTESQLGVQAAKTANNLWQNTVKPALKDLAGEVNTKIAIGNAETKLLSGINNPSRISEIKDAFSALRDDWKSLPTMSHELSQDIKSELYKVLPDKTWKGKPIGSAFKEAQAALAEELRSQTRKAIESSGLPNVKDVLNAFDNYGNYKSLMAFGRKAMTGGKFKGGLGSWLNAAKETVTVPVLTTSGKLLKSAAKKLQ